MLATPVLAPLDAFETDRVNLYVQGCFADGPVGILLQAAGFVHVSLIRLESTSAAWADCVQCARSRLGIRGAQAGEDWIQLLVTHVQLYDGRIRQPAAHLLHRLWDGTRFDLPNGTQPSAPTPSPSARQTHPLTAVRINPSGPTSAKRGSRGARRELTPHHLFELVHPSREGAGTAPDVVLGVRGEESMNSSIGLHH